MTNRLKLLKDIYDLNKDKSFRERSSINNVPGGKVNQPLNYEKPKANFGGYNVNSIIGLPRVDLSQLPPELSNLYNSVLTIYETIYALLRRGLS